MAAVGANLLPIPPLGELQEARTLQLAKPQRSLIRRDGNLAIDSLNWFGGCGRRPHTGRASANTTSKLADLHDEFHQHIEHSACSWVDGAPIISTQSALSRLLRGPEHRPAGLCGNGTA